MHGCDINKVTFLSICTNVFNFFGINSFLTFFFIFFPKSITSMLAHRNRQVHGQQQCACACYYHQVQSSNGNNTQRRPNKQTTSDTRRQTDRRTHPRRPTALQLAACNHPRRNLWTVTVTVTEINHTTKISLALTARTCTSSKGRSTRWSTVNTETAVG